MSHKTSRMLTRSVHFSNQETLAPCESIKNCFRIRRNGLITVPTHVLRNQVPEIGSPFENFGFLPTSFQPMRSCKLLQQRQRPSCGVLTRRIHSQPEKSSDWRTPSVLRRYTSGRKCPAAISSQGNPRPRCHFVNRCHCV